MGLLDDEENRAAFGFFPQMQPRRRLQDVQGSANLPVDVTRGRLAGLLGLIPDVLNFMGRSPMPTETFGETQYDPRPQLPYDTDFYLKNLPLAPTSRAGQVAGQAGSFVPLNPAPAVRAMGAGAQALAPTAARMTERYMQRQGFMPGVVPAQPSGLLTPEIPAQPSGLLGGVVPSMALDESSAVRQQLTAKMQALLAQKKVATSAVEVGAINQQIGELQTQFKSLPTVQRVAREIVAPEITAPVSDLGFYSAAEQAAMNLERSKGTGQSFLNDLMNAPDVKKDELSWIGLDDFLKDKPNVTKQEVQDFIAGNRIDVQEKMLGGNQAPSQDLLSWMNSRNIMTPRNPEGWQELSQKLESYAQQHQKAQGAPETSQRYFTLSEEAGRISEGLDAGGSAAGATRYDKYQLPGGENYREILLTLPDKKNQFPDFEQWITNRYGGEQVPENVRQAAKKEYERQSAGLGISSGYQSSHFNEPNILAHMRVNDRIDADGKKMLLIEEVQSDWHQAGREKGYLTKNTRTPELIENELLAVVQNRTKLLEEAAALPDSEMAKFKAINAEIKRLNDEAKRLDDEFYSVVEQDKGVPDAPLKDTWYQLSLKRLLKYAADNGYERVGLTTGKQQADRYKLSNEVDEINVTGRTNMATGKKSKSVALDLTSGTQYRLGVDNNGVIDNVSDGNIANFKGKKLSEVVGKDIAKQIMEGSSQTIKGEGLNIGGEGMKKYYDEIYPKFLEKYGKKWDAKVGETTIPTDRTRDAQGIPSMYPTKEPIRYIDITSKMKESVSKGQPLFTAAPIGGIGTGLLSDEQRKELSGLLGP